MKAPKESKRRKPAARGSRQYVRTRATEKVMTESAIII